MSSVSASIYPWDTFLSGFCQEQLQWPSLLPGPGAAPSARLLPGETVANRVRDLAESLLAGVFIFGDWKNKADCTGY